MIDIHSHLIFGVDDGPKSLDESLMMAAEAKKAGISAIIATPHFQKHIYERDRVLNNFLELKHRVSILGIDLFLGYEVFINPLLANSPEVDADLTLGGSEYMLLEYPYNVPPEAGCEILLTLQGKGIIPVIAHPERNRHFVKNYDGFLRLTALGALVQVNAASILGIYGSSAKRFVKKLIEADLVDLVASDAHSPDDYKDRYLQSYLEFIRLAGFERASVVFEANGKKLVDYAAAKASEMA